MNVGTVQAWATRNGDHCATFFCMWHSARRSESVANSELMAAKASSGPLRGSEGGLAQRSLLPPKIMPA